MAKKTKKKTTSGSKRSPKKKGKQRPTFPPIYGLMGIIFLISVIYTNTVAAPASAIRNVVLSIILLAFYAYHFLYQKNTLILQSKWLKWFLGLWIGSWLWAICSSFNAINIPEAFLPIGQGLLTIAMIILTASIIQVDKKQFSFILKCLAILGLIHALVGLSQVMGIKLVDSENPPPFGFVFNRTFYGPYVAMLIPFSAALLFAGTTKWKIVGGLAFIAQIIAIILSQTRSSWVAVGFVYLIVHLLVFLFKDRFARQQLRMWWGINLGALVVLVTAFVLALQLNIGGPKVQYTLNRVASLFGGSATYTMANSTMNERLLLWEKCLYIIKDYPVLGVGPGNWKIVAPLYLSEIPSISAGDYFLLRPHNSWLQIAAERGIPAFLAYLAAWVILFMLSFRLIKSSQGFFDRLFYMALLGCITVFVSDMMFSFPHEHIGHLALFAAVAGMIIGLYNRKSKEVKGRLNFPFWGFITIALLLLLNSGNTFRNLRFQQVWLKTFKATGTGQYEEAFIWGEKGKKYWQNLGPNTDPIEVLTSLAYQNQKQFDPALDEIWKAHGHHPNNYRVYNAMGSIYTETQRFAEAEKIYKKCLELTPNYRQALKNHALNYFQWGKHEQCLGVIEKMELFGDEQLTYMLNESRRILGR